MTSIVKTGALSSSTGFNFQRKLARKSNGDLWTAYFRSDGTTYQIYTSYSTDDGQTWTEEQVTSQTGTNHQYAPVIAIDSSDNVHIIWRGLGWGANTTIYNIQYRKRTNSWQTQEGITDVAVNQYDAALAIDSSDNVHVSWYGLGWGTNTTKRNIQYRKRTTSWQTQEAVTDIGEHQYESTIAIDSSDNVHVVWRGLGWGTNTTKANTQYRKRTSSWQTQEAVTDVAATQDYCSIAIDSSDNVHVSWFGLGWGTNPTKGNIQYRERTTSWQTQETVTDKDDQQARPSITIDSFDNIHVVWHGLGWGVNTTIYNIQYRKRTDSWQTQEGLTDEAADQQNPNLIWALHPTIGGFKTNRPKSGYAFVWVDYLTIKFYKSTDLDWEGQPALAGTITAQSGVSGTLSGIWTINGTVVAQSVISGTLGGTWLITGTITTGSTVSGTIKLTKEIVSTPIASISSITGTLRGIQELVSVTIASSSSVTGTIKNTREVTGTVAPSSTISGTIVRDRSIAGTIAGQSGVSGTLTITNITGTITTQSGVSGSLDVTRELVSVAIAAISNVTGTLIVAEELFGTVTTVSSIAGLIDVSRKLATTITVTSGVSGALKVTRELVSVVIGVTSTVNASLYMSRRLVGVTIISTSNVSGSLIKTALETLSGIISVDSSITGRVEISKELVSVAIASTSVISGSIKCHRGVSRTTYLLSTVSGTVTLEVWLAGLVAAQGTVSGPILVTRKLSTLATCTCVISGQARVVYKLTGLIAAQSVVSGQLPYMVVPQFAIVRAINVLPVFAHATHINEELKKDAFTVYSH